MATTVGVLIIRRALAPLNRVAAPPGGANLPLDRGEVALPVRVAEPDANPHTEVGRLGLALNRMLDHIAAALSTRQASEIRVRQFVADASHELRTRWPPSAATPNWPNGNEPKCPTTWPMRWGGSSRRPSG